MSLLSQIAERFRELTRPTAPAPDPDAPHPSAEEWAEWATENLPPRDAELFRRRAGTEAT